jgi:hypothetical protein
VDRPRLPEAAGVLPAVAHGATVADHFGVTKTADVNLAARENWPKKLRYVKKRLGDAAAKNAEESIEPMKERHL